MHVPSGVSPVASATLSHDNPYFMEYAGECVPRCNQVYDLSTCSTLPYCSISNSKCRLHCPALPRAQCFSESYCLYFNGKCTFSCSEHPNSTSCNNGGMCTFNSLSQKCLTNCAVAPDKYTCGRLIDIGGDYGSCRWFPASQTSGGRCLSKCPKLSGSACLAYPHCENVGTGAYSCKYRCSQFTSADDCAAMDDSSCEWRAGACRRSCGELKSSTDCAAAPACGWDSSFGGQCYINNCSSIGVEGTNAGFCETYAHLHKCMLTEDGGCMNSCSNPATVCSSNHRCVVTSSGCADKPCSNDTNKHTCSSRSSWSSGCFWTGTTCVSDEICNPGRYNKTACDQLSPLCFYLPPFSCPTNCEYLPKVGCNDVNYCHWISDSIGCKYEPDTCLHRTRNSTACAAAAPLCENRRDSFFDTCLPVCSLADNEEDCSKSKFFQTENGCFWDKSQSKCVRTCEYIEDMSSCTGPCEWNANFSRCVQKPTMMPSSSPSSSSSPTTSSPGNNPGDTTVSVSHPSITTAGPQQQQTSTTSAPSTNGQQTTVSVSHPSYTPIPGSTTSSSVSTTTTASPPAVKRNPRVKFALAASKSFSGTAAEIQSFITSLAQMLSIPSNAISASFEASDNSVVVEFNAEAKDSSGNTVDVDAEVTAAASLSSTQLSTLGAASVETAEPAPAPANPAPEDDGANLPLILGATIGGIVVLGIAAFIIKKQTSGGTGASYLTDDQPGDRPMLELPQHQTNNSNQNGGGIAL